MDRLHLSIKFHKDIALGRDQAQTWITYNSNEIPSDHLEAGSGVILYAYSVRKDDSPVKFLKDKEYRVDLFNMSEGDFEITFVEKNPKTLQNIFSFYAGKSALDPTLEKTLAILYKTSIFTLKCSDSTHRAL